MYVSKKDGGSIWARVGGAANQKIVDGLCKDARALDASHDDGRAAPEIADSGGEDNGESRSGGRCGDLLGLVCHCGCIALSRLSRATPYVSCTTTYTLSLLMQCHHSEPCLDSLHGIVVVAGGGAMASVGILPIRRASPFRADGRVMPYVLSTRK